jgi:hypothetical protein
LHATRPRAWGDRCGAALPCRGRDGGHRRAGRPAIFCRGGIWRGVPKVTFSRPIDCPTMAPTTIRAAKERSNIASKVSNDMVGSPLKVIASHSGSAAVNAPRCSGSFNEKYQCSLPAALDSARSVAASFRSRRTPQWSSPNSSRKKRMSSVQLTSQLLYIDGFAFERERGVAQLRMTLIKSAPPGARQLSLSLA